MFLYLLSPQSAEEVKEIRRDFFTDYLKQGGPELKAHMEASEQHQAEQAKGNSLTPILGNISIPTYGLTLDLVLLFFPANPEDLKEVFDLDFLAKFDLEQLPDIEDYGDEVLGQIQATMQELYGDRMAACMPEDRIQSCMMGVSCLSIEATILFQIPLLHTNSCC